MSNTVSVEIDGLRELEARLKDLAPAFQGKKGFPGNPLRNAVRAGTKIIQERASALAPVDPETATSLKDAIDIRIVSVKERDIATRQGDSYEGYDIGYRTKGNQSAMYGGWVELGTDKMAAQPYLRPALQEAGGKAIDALKQKLSTDLDKIVKKLAVMK